MAKTRSVGDFDCLEFFPPIFIYLTHKSEVPDFQTSFWYQRLLMVCRPSTNQDELLDRY